MRVWQKSALSFFMHKEGASLITTHLHCLSIANGYILLKKRRFSDRKAAFYSRTTYCLQCESLLFTARKLTFSISIAFLLLHNNRSVPITVIVPDGCVSTRFRHVFRAEIRFVRAAPILFTLRKSGCKLCGRNSYIMSAWCYGGGACPYGLLAVHLNSLSLFP